MNNKKIIYVLVFFSALFLSLAVYLTTVGVYKRDEYAKKDLGRSLKRETDMQRGDIYDRNGEKIAYTKIENNKASRIYPYKNLYSHLVGYYTEKRGSSLLENRYSNTLNSVSVSDDVMKIASFLNNKKPKGSDLYLTADHRLQKKCSEILSPYKEGAIIVSNPKTGEIYAMVSKPDFDPSESNLYKNWDKMSTDDTLFPFLTRATQGLYAPGSTYKIVTSAAMIKNGKSSFTAEDKGKTEINGTTIKNAKSASYGNLDLQSAFAHSSNVYFALAGIETGENALRSMSESFMMNKDFDIKDFYLARSVFPEKIEYDDSLALASIGQDKVLISPMHLNLITCAIANDGKMPDPYLVAKVKSNLDSTEKHTSAKMLKQAIDAQSAQIIKDNMKKAVDSGTGAGAAIAGKNICGKTGTAENEKTNENPNLTHSWFTSFAPYENPTVCVTVLLAYSGSSSLAASAAQRVYSAYYSIFKE